MRCIACEELELARVRDQNPSQTLPLPATALAGLPGGRSSTDLTRRSLLKYGAAGAALVYGTRALGFEEVFESAVAEAAGGVQNTVVLIYLAGGNDGLNVVLPDGKGTNAAQAQYAAYVGQRSRIYRGLGADANGRPGSTPLGGTSSTLAMANVMYASANDSGGVYGFDKLYGAGDAASQLALIPACDYTPPSLSHFDSSDYWFAGATEGLSTGWLGRWLDNNGSDSNPLQGVSIDDALSKSIRTSRNPVCALPSTDDLGFAMDQWYGRFTGDYSQADVNAPVENMAGIAAHAGNAFLARTRASYGQSIGVADQGTTIDATGQSSIAYQNGSDLANKLRLAAQVIGARLGTRVVTVHWGGFDTHGDQLASQDSQLRELSWALAAFQADLKQRGVENKVITAGFSEFGRRVEDNDSGGTDHGAGGLMFVSGSQVRGGLVGQFPGCRPQDLDQDGDLKVATDFRSVYQAILQEWLGGDLTGVLPGTTPFPKLDRHDGGAKLFRV